MYVHLNLPFLFLHACSQEQVLTAKTVNYITIKITKMMIIIIILSLSGFFFQLNPLNSGALQEASGMTGENLC